MTAIVRSIIRTPAGWVAEGRVGSKSYQVDPARSRTVAIRAAEDIERQLACEHCSGTGRVDRPEESGGCGNGETIACAECAGEGVE